MAADEPSWTLSDAWVLTAIAVYADPGCTLTELMSAADAMNHAIIDEGELAQGVGRLSASGLVTVVGDLFTLTGPGRALAARRRGGLMGQVQSVHSLLRQVDLQDGRWQVPPEALDAAYAAYKLRLSGSG